MFVPDGYLSVGQAVEHVARLRAPGAAAALTPEACAFLASLDAAMRPRPAAPLVPIRPIHEHRPLAPASEARRPEPTPASATAASPEAKAESLVRLCQARKTLGAAREAAGLGLRQALVSGTLLAAAVAEDGTVAEIPPARWRAFFTRRGDLWIAEASSPHWSRRPEWRPQARSVEPFPEALAGRPVPLAVAPDGSTLAWGNPIIARAALARWCDAEPETAPTGAAAQASSTVAAEKRLTDWLTRLMRSRPDNPPGKAKVKEMAQAEGHTFSGQAFKRAYANAVAAAGTPAWSAAGRKSTRPIETAD